LHPTSGPADSRATRTRINSSKVNGGGRLYGPNAGPKDGIDLTHPTRLI
jgi:hypothetical protein